MRLRGGGGGGDCDAKVIVRNSSYFESYLYYPSKNMRVVKLFYWLVLNLCLSCEAKGGLGLILAS